MKLLKKSISVLIVCTMIFSLSAIITQSFGFDYVETQATESDFIVTEDGAKYSLTYGGKSLELIYLPESISGDYIVPSEINGLKVTRIIQDAFLYTNDIKSITIPETVTSCDFSYCQSLEKIIVDENNPEYSSDGFGVLYNKDKTELLFFPSNCKVKNYVLPASVEEIQTIESGVKVENFSVEDGNEFFSADENGILFNKDKTELVRYPSDNKRTEYTAPSSVTKIGDHAFSCSENLKDIMIPLNVTSIDDCAFVHCIGLRKLTIALRKADESEENYDSEERFEEFTAHQLRHTYCSMLQWSGVDIKTAQELMGHSEYGVIANIYTHIDEQSKTNAAKLQERYIEDNLI